jgi:hypothetical protein
LESNFRIDVRPILPTLSAPTLVIDARDDTVPIQGSRNLADHIPGVRYLEVDGADHAPWFTEPDKILTGIEEFLTGSHAAPAQHCRAHRGADLRPGLFICGRWPGRAGPSPAGSTVSAWPSPRRRDPSGASRPDGRGSASMPALPRPKPGVSALGAV